MASKTTAAKTPASTAPQYAVIDDVIHYTSKAGDKIEMDLDFPSSALKDAMDGDKTEEDQFKVVAELFGPDFKAAYDRMGALESRRLLRTFFFEFQKAASMPLGESLGSSDS